MTSDKRSERSGRYGSASDRDSHFHRDDREYRSRRRESETSRSSDDRRSDRDDGYREYDSPEQRHRVRRNSDRSEDADYAAYDNRHDLRDEQESTCILLWGLPIKFTGLNIRKLVESGDGPKPADVRLMKKRKGISRGFAFVDFFDLQDSTSWMEANQNKLVIQGKNIQMRYSRPMPKREDWLCDKCQEFNFRRRSKCYRCHARRTDSEEDTSSDAPEMSATIILSNIAPHTVKQSIVTALSPYTSHAIVNIRLIKDEQTQRNRGFAFVQLASKLEAAQLLQSLHSLNPPFKIDGMTIRVGFSKRARKQPFTPNGNRTSAFSVTRTANPAAQWSSTPAQGEGEDYNYQDGYGQYSQYSQDYRRFYQADGGAGSAAGIGSSTSTSSVGVSQSPQLCHQPGSSLGLVAAYSGDSDNEEEQERCVSTDADRWTDLKKLACLLCRRQFPNRDALIRHQQLSDLHKQNLEQYRSSKLSEQDMKSLEQRDREKKYLHRAAERREKYGIPEPPEPKRKKHFESSTVNYEQPTKDCLDASNNDNKMLQSMGWKEGLGQGRKAQGVSAPIQAEERVRGSGSGATGSSYKVSTSGSYKDAVRKAMFARFKEIE